MPGCSHPCRICAETQTLAHAYIHSGQIHEWEHARAYTTHARAHTHTNTHTHVCARTHTHTHTHTHARVRAHARIHTHILKCMRPTWIYQLDGRRDGRYMIIHPVCLVFFFEKKERRKTNSFTKYDTNLYPSSPFFFFCFASQWFQVNHFVLAVWKGLLTTL